MVIVLTIFSFSITYGALWAKQQLSCVLFCSSPEMGLVVIVFRVLFQWHTVGIDNNCGYHQP